MSESPADRGGERAAAEQEPAADREPEVEVVDAEIVEPESGSAADPGAADPQEPAGAEAAAEPESELQAARRERDEYLDLAQRARAELDNYRRRMSGEATTAEQRGRVAVARDLLPALDNLERALLAAGVNPDGDPPEGEPASHEVSAQTALAEGVALVYRELREGLQRAGVESFHPVGEPFDPAMHEAVATGQQEGAAKGAVIEVLEKGYRIGEQVLRPARVVVAG